MCSCGSLQLALANGAMDLAHQLLKLGAPGDALPSYLTADEDLDYDEVSLRMVMSSRFPSHELFCELNQI